MKHTSNAQQMTMKSKIWIILCLWAGMTTTLYGQDIEVTDSTSSEWGDDLGGGGITPSNPTGPVTSITISKTALTLAGGECYRLTAKVNDTAANKKVNWSVADATIASVDDDGTVMGLKKGSTTVTATAQGNTNVKATCNVTVKSEYVPTVSEWILPWGKEEAWTMKYQYFEQSEYTDPPKDTAGRDWKQLGYNDSKWPTLTGPMGSEGIWYSTYNYLWQGENNCFCLRRTFNLKAVAQDAVYTFYVQHDDDIKVYINGQLVVEDPNWTDERIASFIIPNNVFRAGTNQLAIYIQQNWGGAFLDYALFQKVPQYGSNVNLPNIPFEFFYQAKDYNQDGHFIPNHKKANLKEAMLQLTENTPTLVDKKLLRITDRCEGYLDKWDKYSNESGAHFYREGDNSMTIVCKVAPRLSANGAADFISNRGNDYNYMLRIGAENGFYLHTRDPYSYERTLRFDSEAPQVLAIRAFGEDNYILLENLTTGQNLRINGINWGGGDNIFKFFYNDGGEFYLGDFYWAYYSFELLTDQQVKQVADAAEGKTNVFKGDANGDGTINVTDVMTVVGYILNTELPAFYFINADVDDDNIVNVTDAMLIVDIILGKL
jgi:hypothetical protein